MKNLLILSCFFMLFSCKKDQIPAKTVLSFKLDWKEKLTENPAGGSSREPVVYSNTVIFHKMFDGPNDVFIARKISDGAKVWSWQNPQDIPDGEYIGQYKLVDGQLVVCSWHEFNLVDANNGQPAWRTDVNDENGCGEPRMAVFDRKIYHGRIGCESIPDFSETAAQADYFCHFGRVGRLFFLFHTQFYSILLAFFFFVNDLLLSLSTIYTLLFFVVG